MALMPVAETLAEIDVVVHPSLVFCLRGSSTATFPRSSAPAWAWMLGPFPLCGFVESEVDGLAR